MADVSKIKLPNNTEVNIKDSRISGVDTTPTSGSSNVITSGGVYTAVQNAIGSVYRVKGTKATYAELPSSGNVTGDVWNVTAAYGNYPPGTNWVWTGSAWDALGGSVDLSGCQPLDADLTAIAGLSGTSGLLKKTAANTWSLDTNTYARVYSYNLAGASSVNITFAEGMYHAMIIARYTQTSEPLILIGAGYGDASVRNRFKQINTEEISIRWRYISGEGIQIVNTTSGQNARVSVLVTTGSGPTFTAATYDTTSAFEDYTLLKTSTAASKYLPLAGGTLTGTLTARSIHVSTGYGITFYDRNNNAVQTFLYDEDNIFRLGNPYRSTWVGGSGDLYHDKGSNQYKIWDESNLNPNKVGTSTVGGTAKPIYLNAGTPTAFSTTIGNSDRPVFVNSGTITQVSSINGNIIYGKISDSTSSYLVSHPERSGCGVLVPFIYNDIAFLVQRGGHISVYSTTDTDLTKETLTVKHQWGSDSTFNALFDGSPSYYNFGNTTAEEMAADGIIIDITLPQTFTYSNKFYIDFGAAWGFSTVEVLVKLSAYETTFTSKISNTSDANRNSFNSSLSHSVVDTGGTTRQGFDRMRIHLVGSPNTTSGRRIAQIGLINYGSAGVRNTYMSRGINDRVWRTISPDSTNTYSLGESSYRWSNVYSVLGNFSGALNLDTSGGASAYDTSKGLNFTNGSTTGHIGLSSVFGIYSSSGIYIRPNGATSTAAGNGSIEISSSGITAYEAITAEGFKKSGGTSSQFLKADGSVDSNTYALASAIPAAVTESTVAGWGFTKNTGTLTGVKFNNVSATVSNGVASITATIPTVNNSTITFQRNGVTVDSFTTNSASNKTINFSDAVYEDASESGVIHSPSGFKNIDGKDGKYYAVGPANADGTEDYILATTNQLPTESTVSGWGFTKNAGTITGITMNGSSKGTSGVVDLGTVITSHAKHKLNATNGTATSTSGTITFVESLTGTTTATDGDLSVSATRKTVTIPAAQVQSDWNATSGMGVILNKPTIPSAPGTLVTNNTTAQTASSSEALSGTINLHKVAKTGTYSDLIGTPTIPTVDSAPTSGSSNAVSSGGVYTAINEIPPYSVYNFTNGCLVKTTYTSTDNHTIYANIEGRTRGKHVFSTKLTAYYVSSAFNSSYLYAERYGWSFGNISLFVYNGYIYLWFKQPSDYCHFFITVYGLSSSGPTKNLVDTVTNSAIPSGATATASVTPLAVTLPTVSTTDNGKVLTVSNGAWTAESLPSTPTFYSGTSDPSSSLGANGDIYIKLSS